VESNSQEEHSVKEYDELQKMMVDLYRKKWKSSGIPFYWVQLSSIDTASYKSQLWPEFRNTQRLLLKKIDNSGMAVCSDIGAKNNVHPTNKKAVGERLAKWARFQTYKEKIVPSGPLPLTATYKKEMLLFHFNTQLQGYKLG
jgi:sialate O-acetylesterase